MVDISCVCKVPRLNDLLCTRKLLKKQYGIQTTLYVPSIDVNSL